MKVKINEKTVVEVELLKDKKLLDKKIFEADVLQINDRKFHIIKDNRSIAAEIIAVNFTQKKIQIRVNDNDYYIEVKDHYDELLKELGMENFSSVKVNQIKAPMPGLVLRIMVEEKQELKKGDAVLILEAMKMENVLKSPGDGIIKLINVKKGDKVEKNDLLLALE